MKELGDYEKNALVIKAYIAHFIPVPLQTEAYARAVLQTVRLAKDVEQEMQGRMARTEKLLKQKTSLWVLIEESALELDWLDSDEAKSEQLQRLLDLSEQVSVRVIKHAKRIHGGTAGSFEVITTATGQDVGYIWAQIGDCVEVADLGASVGVRDSKAPQGGYLVVGRDSLAGVVRRIRMGE